MERPLSSVERDNLR